MTNLTNLQTYLAIAKEALAESEARYDTTNVTMADGEPGVVVALDPAQGSFKHSLVAIVFACIYLEALLYVVDTQHLGPSYRDSGTYEEKLRALGVGDSELLAAVERLRNVRRSIVHEKAAAAAHVKEFFLAQTEAARALALVHQISTVLLTEPAADR